MSLLQKPRKHIPEEALFPILSILCFIHWAELVQMTEG